MIPSADTPTARSLLRPGTRLGRYQIIRGLAVGGMAELYLARHVGAAGYQKVVALKRVRPHLADDAGFVARFLNEARLAANLDHSNIAHVIDFGTDRGEHFMAMEYVHGRSTFELLHRFESCPLSLSCALLIVRDVAAALHYAHERTGPDGRPLGLVHRDVSPSNVLVSFDGDVKLVDFGIAKATAEGNATRTGTILGKIAYMAPEQLRGQRIDRRADVFALGTMAYELTTGMRCFYAEGEFALINRVVASRFDRPSKVIDGFPPALEQILVRALAADPEARFADAQALQLAIEAFATDAGHSLSKVELSEHMRRCFGDEEYPRTDVVPLPTAEIAEPVVDALPEATSGNRRRSLVVWVSAALVAGLVVGLASRDWVDDAEATVPSDASSAARASEVAPVDPEPDAEPSVDEAEHADAAAQAPAPAGTRASDIAEAPKHRRSRARPKARRKSRSATASPAKAASADDNALRDFTPPSRRRDR